MKHLVKRFAGGIGWYGACATLTAFFLVSFALVDARSLPYQILNLSGAVGLGIICYFKKTYQPLVVNIIWGGIALIAILDILF